MNGLIMSYVIRVNQFTDGYTGHTNVTFMGTNSPAQTYGANLSPSVGVQDEHAQTMIRIANNPSAYSYKDVVVSEEYFNRTLSFAQAADAGNNSYSIFCNNCVDFVDQALTVSGAERFSSHQYFKDGTMLDLYAKVSAMVCDPQMVYGDWAVGANTYVKPELAYMNSAVLFHKGTYFAQGPSTFHLYDELKSKLGISSWDDEVETNKNYVYENAPTPLIVDLNGDGVNTISLEASQVFFDTIGDGVARKTGWVDAHDAFLVQDVNANGLIEDVNELFGGSGRSAGFKKLALLDSNNDGFITAQDEDFLTLLLWQDSNSDGISQVHELKSLNDWGLTSIDLAFQETQIFNNHNFIGEISTVILDGQQAKIGDAYLSIEYA